MIEDARKLDRSEIQADVVIVGTGPAGMAIGSRLLGYHWKVVLLEAGGRAPNLSLQRSVWSGDEISPGHPPLHLYRRRVLGGTSTVWGGGCVPLDESDCKSIPTVRPESWPISHSILREFYPAALDFLDAGTFEFDAANALGHEGSASPEHPNGLTFDRIDRFSLPTNVARKFRTLFATAQDARLLLNAPCVEVMTTSNARNVSGVRCNVDGRNLEVRAPFVILANGGLESTRLLLVSKSVMLNGLGNENNLLGRHYMTHLTGELGHLFFGDRISEQLLDLKRTSDGIYCRRTIQLRSDVREQFRILNIVIRPTLNDLQDPRHNHVALSVYYLARCLMSPEQRRKLDRSLSRESGLFEADTRRHLRIVFRQLPSAIAFAAAWIVAKRMRRRRIPLLHVRHQGGYPLEFTAEQRPNPLSRVFLSEACDPLGMQRLSVDWRVTDDDKNTIRRGYELVRHGLASSGSMSLRFEDSELHDALCRARPSGGHHMGTARMGESQRTGVVGPDCEVWGTKGLFVASSAVFPTSGAASPTLTVVALSLRIAEHLKAGLRRSC